MDKFSAIKRVSGWILATLLISGQALAQTATTITTPAKAKLQSLTEPLAPLSRTPLKIKGFKTLSGTKILFIQTSGLPMFDVQVSFAAGSAHTPHQPGLAALTFSLMNEGVPGKDFNATQEIFDSLGAILGMRINQDRATFSLRSLNDEARRTPALELFTQVLGNPLKEEKSLSKVKSELLHYLDLQALSNEQQAHQALNGLLFPGHGYAQSTYGTRSSLASITLAQAQAFHHQAYAAGNALITLVGNISEVEAQRIGAQIANSLPEGPALAALQTPADAVMAHAPQRIDSPSPQTYLLLAQPAVQRNSPDYLALHWASQIFTNRLFKDLREQRGLTYDISARMVDRQAQGTLMIQTQIRPETADAVLARIKEMFSHFIAEGPTEEEFHNLQRRLAGSEPLKSAGNARLLARLHDINVNALPLELSYSTDQSLKLNLESITDALGRNFDPDNWQVVVLGPQTDQQPLPEPVESEANAMCRAADEFVAS